MVAVDWGHLDRCFPPSVGPGRYGRPCKSRCVCLQQARPDQANTALLLYRALNLSLTRPTWQDQVLCSNPAVSANTMIRHTCWWSQRSDGQGRAGMECADPGTDRRPRRR
jgi:hypothetical protein